MSKRNYGSTPRPAGYKYSRQALSMPVAVKGVVRRGKIIGKAGEGEDVVSDKQHTHHVWHITSASDKPGHVVPHANVSATTAPEAVTEAKRIFPHLKDKDLSANIVSSTAHTPPDWPASHHYELERNKQGYQKNDEGFEKANQAIWNHQRGQTPDFPLVGADKAQATKMDARMPKAPAATAKIPEPKKPGSSITMDWLNSQKKLLTQKSEDADIEGLLWLFGTAEGQEELAKMVKEEAGEPLKKNKSGSKKA